MTDPKEKDRKPPIQTRTPGRLSRGSMFDRVKLREEPHPIEQILGLHSSQAPAVDPDQTQTSTRPVPEPDQYQTRTGVVPEEIQSQIAQPSALVESPAPAQRTGLKAARPRAKASAAPERDFGRVANSITRDALPAGAFPGSSKKIYDVLYFRTRAAVTPVRSVRATRRELMQWTGIKNVKTVNDHIKRLIDAGLLVRTKLAGEHEGSIYEVILPEETNQHQTRTSTRPVPVPDPYQRQTEEVPEPNQKTDSDQYQNSVRVGSGNLIDLIATSGEPKTSFKTKNEKPDDEAFAPLVARLRKTVTDLTGKEPTAADAARWDELGELLDAELRIAAGRTGSVSSVPAFLTEHLRRRLWKKDKRQVEEEGKVVGSKRSETTKVDALKCPDCFGTGMHYPEGFDKGVARCRHEKLIASAAPAASATAALAPAAQPPTDGDLVEVAVGFLHQGMDIDAVGQLLSASIDAEEWPRVRTDALERYERERGQMRPPEQA